MEALLGVIQEVELVSDQSWLSENLGSVVVAVAAITAAFLAAWVANRNHKGQLAHDRFLQNQEDTRAVMDAAVEAMSDASEAFTDYVYMGGSDTERFELHNTAQEKINGVKYMTDRLRLRMGEKHEITEKHREVAAELQEVLKVEIERRGGHVAPQEPPNSETARKEIWASVKAPHDEFCRACHSWLSEASKRRRRKTI